MYDQITTTLYRKTAQLNPAILDIVNRTRVVGLHKVAAHITERDEFTLRDAVQELGTKLAYDYLKNQKIASGLGSLRELHNADIVKFAMFRHVPGGVENLLRKRRVLPGTPKMPQTFGGPTSVHMPSDLPPAPQTGTGPAVFNLQELQRRAQAGGAGR